MKPSAKKDVKKFAATVIKMIQNVILIVFTPVFRIKKVIFFICKKKQIQTYGCNFLSIALARNPDSASLRFFIMLINSVSLKLSQ